MPSQIRLAVALTAQDLAIEGPSVLVSASVMKFKLLARATALAAVAGA